MPTNKHAQQNPHNKDLCKVCIEEVMERKWASSDERQKMAAELRAAIMESSAPIPSITIRRDDDVIGGATLTIASHDPHNYIGDPIDTNKWKTDLFPGHGQVPYHGQTLPNTQQIQITTQGTTNFEPFVSEHVHEVDALMFQGDILVGRCTECDDVITVTTFPGGLTALKSKEVLETYAANKKSSKLLDSNLDLGGLIDQIKLLKQLLGLDKTEIDLAIDRLTLVERDILICLNAEMADSTQ